MRSKAKVWAILHLVVLLGVIYWNYYSNTGNINGTTVGEMSDKYDSLFTPAGYTFAIWGVIYLGLLYYGVYMLYTAFSNKKGVNFILQTAPWVTLAHALNGTWLWFWLNEYTGLCAVLISLIFLSLLIAVFRSNMQKFDPPVSFIAGAWWPIDLYAGWLAVAAIANISAHLNTTAWAANQDEVMWTIILLITATLVNLLMIFARNMREFAAVGIWAFIGIAVRHWGEIEAIQYTALAGAVVLAIASGFHAFKNRETLPFVRKQAA